VRSVRTVRTVRLTLLIVGVSFVATVARVTGLGFGLPHHLFHPDENLLISTAARMAAGADWNPHFFHWGGAHFYVTATVFRIAPVVSQPAATADLYLIARMLSAVMGAATVAVTMLICHRLYRNDRLTALAGLTLALMPLHVRCSHYATVDAAATFWMSLSVWCFLKAIDAGPDRRWLIATGVIAGVAMGTKYTLGMVPPVMAVACFVSTRGSARRWLAPAIVLGAAAAGFVMSNPYAVLDLQAFLTGVRELSTHYDNPSLHPRNYSDHNILFFLSTLASGESDPVVLFAAAIGIGVLARSERRPHVLALAAAPVLMFLYLGSRRANYIRNLLPLLPFLAIACAIGLTSVAAWFARTRARTVIAGLVIAAGLAWSAQHVIRIDRVLSRPDSRDLAADWIAANLPAGSKVAVEREHWGYPTLPASLAPSTMILVDEPLSYYVQNGFDYIITTSISYQAFFDYPERMEGKSQAYRAWLANLDAQASRMATFTGPSIGVPVNDELPNPEIRIYKLLKVH
jgi:4-amino-4-deoxy-L-arabinose transferase-like glycosyltransferase